MLNAKIIFPVKDFQTEYPSSEKYLTLLNSSFGMSLGYRSVTSKSNGESLGIYNSIKRINIKITTVQKN